MKSSLSSLHASVSVLVLCLLRSGAGFNSYSFFSSPLKAASPVRKVGDTTEGKRFVTRLSSNKLEERPSTEEKVVDDKQHSKELNGKRQPEHSTGFGIKARSDTEPALLDAESLAAKTYDDVVELIAEIDRRVSDGSSEILQNLTQGIDEKPALQPLPGNGLEPSDSEPLDGHRHPRPSQGTDHHDEEHGKHLRGLYGGHGFRCVWYDGPA